MKIKEVLDQAIKYPIEIGRQLNWEDPFTYASWSAQTFYFVNHSTRLFSAAAARCPLTDNNFHFRFLKHLEDEKGHENLSINDLKVLGFDLSNIPEYPSTQGMYQAQYYWIEHVHPYSFFGYLLALEGLAVTLGPEVYERVRGAHGDKASKFLKIHTEEDIAHIEEALQWVEKMPNTLQKQVEKNLYVSAGLYGLMLQEVGIAAKESSINLAA